MSDDNDIPYDFNALPKGVWETFGFNVAGVYWAINEYCKMDAKKCTAFRGSIARRLDHKEKWVDGRIAILLAAGLIHEVRREGRGARHYISDIEAAAALDALTPDEQAELKATVLHSTALLSQKGRTSSPKKGDSN